MRASGRLRVMSRTPSARLGEDGVAHAAKSVSAGIALAAQLGEVDLHPGEPARLGEHPRLRLDGLGRQHPAALASAGSSRMRSR